MVSHTRTCIALVLTAAFIASCSDPSDSSSDTTAFANKDGGPPKVRLHFPSEALETYPLRGWKGGIDVARTYSYIWETSEIKKFEELQFVSEAKSKIILANDYFPIRSGLSWSYRKRVFSQYGVSDNNKVRDIALLYYWRNYHLPPGLAISLSGKEDAVMSVRGQTTLTVATHAKEAAPSPEIYAEESYTVGTPETQGSKQLFPISIIMQPPHFPSRYGTSQKTLDASLVSVGWFREKTSNGGDIVYENTIYSEIRPSGISPGDSRDIELSSLRPLLFDAPKSLIFLYNNSSVQPALVRHGYITQAADHPVITPAGQFNDCIRVIEYVLDRDVRNPLSLPDKVPEARVDHGWYTVSWYARGVGLVAEIQFDRAGTPTYWMDLIKRSGPFSEYGTKQPPAKAGGFMLDGR